MIPPVARGASEQKRATSGSGASAGEGFLPTRKPRGRGGPESAFVRIVATAGIVAIGVALGAILVSEKVEGWIVGLVVAAVSVILAAVLWSSRRL